MEFNVRYGKEPTLFGKDPSFRRRVFMKEKTKMDLLWNYAQHEEVLEEVQKVFFCLFLFFIYSGYPLLVNFLFLSLK